MFGIRFAFDAKILVLSNNNDNNKNKIIIIIIMVVVIKIIDVKGEVHTITCHKSKEGLETLDGGGGGERHVPAAIPPGMTRCTLYIQPGFDPGQSSQ
jgi:hypothetical protein